MFIIRETRNAILNAACLPVLTVRVAGFPSLEPLRAETNTLYAESDCSPSMVKEETSEDTVREASTPVEKIF